MAKFCVTYDINLGDVVKFKTFDGEVETGTVQCVSEFPDIFVEINPPFDKQYRRTKISVKMIIEDYTNDDWREMECSFSEGEPLEFVYDKNYDRIVTNRFSDK